ncbi:MAG: NUDIX domain-containing protein [Acidimicrobiia bacterium]|nr:NUDIX domain-containing protein [Acidimicrobiia bacterium]
MSGQDGFDHGEVPIKPAATVILVRDGREGVEALLLRRDEGLAFHGGSWVFPGGRLDPEDFERAGSEDEVAAARFAAAREAKEEADLDLTPDEMVPFSHWTTPKGRNRRFSTSFFVGLAPAGEVTVDDGEIRAFGWLTAARAIADCDRGELQLAAPGYVSLLRLARYGSAAEAVEHTRSHAYEVFKPRIAKAGDGQVHSLYQEDVSYESLDLGLRGPLHRTLMLVNGGFRYIREF